VSTSAGVPALPRRRMCRQEGLDAAYRRWWTTLRFDHPAVQPVLPNYIHCGRDAEARVGQLRRQIAELALSWSMAPVVAALRAMRGIASLVADGRFWRRARSEHSSSA
jgi:hypothetical protein